MIRKFKKKISVLIKESYFLRKKAKENYEKAENILIEELDLLHFEMKHKLTFTITKKEIDKAKRFDAEYFQPKICRYY